MATKLQEQQKGHRHRLRKKFQQSKGKALEDYEVLELFLFFCIPYKDTKPIAKDLLKTFGSLEGIVFAEEVRLCEVEGIGPKTALALQVCGALILRQLRKRIERGPTQLNSWEHVIDYCRLSDAYKTKEEAHILFLNKKNHLIADEILFSGTIDQTPFDVRDIIKRALNLNATALILVHNHPSGDATPSQADINETRNLYHAAKMMGLTLHDHFIVAKNGYTSLRNLGLLE